jgi:ectoine hydroxylase-related dioxygenase (phytanoyl-CoA dioxygenase family)
MSLLQTLHSVRTTPLTSKELTSFRERGFVVPGRLLADEQVETLCEAIEEHLSGRLERTVTYDLADVSLDTTKGLRMESAASAEEEAKKREKAERTLPVLFNLWEIDERFRDIAMHPVAAGWGGQLLETGDVRIFEDTAFIKPARKGGSFPWHQDYSVWPIATPDVVGCWIALDDVDPENGTITYAVGSHKSGEVLPVENATGAPYLHEQRPGIPEIGDPVAMGMEIHELVLKRGECVFQHALTWHASGPNNSDRPRRAHGVRYIAGGTIWLGEHRYPYRPDAEMDFPVPGPVNASARFPRVERAF